MKKFIALILALIAFLGLLIYLSKQPEEIKEAPIEIAPAPVITDITNPDIETPVIGETAEIEEQPKPLRNIKNYEDLPVTAIENLGEIVSLPEEFAELVNYLENPKSFHNGEKIYFYRYDYEEDTLPYDENEIYMRATNGRLASYDLKSEEEEIVYNASELGFSFKADGIILNNRYQIVKTYTPDPDPYVNTVSVDIAVIDLSYKESVIIETDFSESSYKIQGGKHFLPFSETEFVFYGASHFNYEDEEPRPEASENFIYLCNAKTGEKREILREISDKREKRETFCEAAVYDKKIYALYTMLLDGEFSIFVKVFDENGELLQEIRAVYFGENREILGSNPFTPREFHVYGNRFFIREERGLYGFTLMNGVLEQFYGADVSKWRNPDRSRNETPITELGEQGLLNNRYVLFRASWYSAEEDKNEGELLIFDIIDGDARRFKFEAEDGFNIMSGFIASEKTLIIRLADGVGYWEEGTQIHPEYKYFPMNATWLTAFMSVSFDPF